jgi:T4 bacteriophage base plate protein
MSQTQVEGAFPHLPPAPDIPGPNKPDDFMPVEIGPINYTKVGDFVPPPDIPGLMAPNGGPPPTAKSTSQVEAEMSAASKVPIPTMDDVSGLVHLPGGWLRDGELVRTAIVRELNGYDEEKLSRLLSADNPATYVTEMLFLATEDLGGQKPSKDDLRSLLIGDRDALWLGIRIASYGPEVEYNLTCTECDAESAVFINLNEDIPIKELEDPYKQGYDVELRHGVARIKLLDGYAQEKTSEGLAKKTQAEINTIMLANSVTDINGIRTKGREDAVRELSSQDRGTILDYIVDIQPGPQIGTEIEVHCAKCNAMYPIVLSPPSLFRF